MGEGGKLWEAPARGSFSCPSKILNCLGQTVSRIRALGTLLVRPLKEVRDVLLEPGGRGSLLVCGRKHNKIIACSVLGSSKSKRQVWISGLGRGGQVAQCGEHNRKEPRCYVLAEC